MARATHGPRSSRVSSRNHWQYALTTGRAPARRTARLRRAGDVWHVGCEGELVELRDMKGVAYLRDLLRHPGHEVHALDLAGAKDLVTGDAGEILDADARRAYKARLAELRRRAPGGRGVPRHRP